jgi:hypothetical protein
VVSPNVDKSAVVIKSLNYLSYVGKFAGLFTAHDGIPFVDPSVGIIIFAGASLLKDTAKAQPSWPAPWGQ